MTVNNSANKVIAAGNGVQTVFNFGFIAVAPSDITVILTDSLGHQTTLLPSAYTLALNPVGSGQLWSIGGSVTYPLIGSPVPNGSTLTIERQLSLTQLVSLSNQGNVFPSAVETALDLLEMQLQQISEEINRAIVAPIVDPSTINLTLPAAAQRANTGLAFDGSGNVIAGITPATGLISTAMQPVVDAATLAIGRTAFGLGAMATEGFGSGLIDDGAGNARVNNPIVQVATNQTVTAAFDLERFIATGPINFNCPRANTLWNGFGFWLEAVGGDVTLVIDSHDKVAGNISSGTAFVVPAGANVFVTTDAATSGNWYVEGMPWLVQNVVTSGVGGAYNISARDNAKILKHNSGAFGTFIFPAAATLRADFRCLIINGETTPIGKGVGGTDQGSFRQYPGQAYLVINDNGTMRVVGGKQLYIVNSVAVYLDTGLGSDDPLLSDGLSTGARANKTANNMYTQFKRDFDHNGSGGASMNTMAGNLHESLTLNGQPINCPVFFLNGPSALGTTWQPTGNASPFCWIIGDGCVMEWSNILLDASNLTGGTVGTAIQMHQTAICDQNSGCGFGSFGNPGGSHVTGDGTGWTYNVNASYAVNGAGGAAVHINNPAAGFVNISGSITVTITNAPNIGKWFALFGSGSNISLGTSITFSGSILAGGQKWSSGPGAVLNLNGNAANIPGTVAGNPATGSAPTASTGWANA